MADLSDYRKKIDEIDEQIVRLISSRMEVSKEIAEYKASQGTEVLDSSREEEKLNAVAGLAPNECDKKAVRGIFKQILTESKEYQYEIIKNLK